jgi:hypothetical protein
VANTHRMLRMSAVVTVVTVALAGTGRARAVAPARENNCASLSGTERGGSKAVGRWSVVHTLASALEQYVAASAELMRVTEAEWLYSEHRLPDAAANYERLLTRFPSSIFRAHALRRLYEIGDYWLEDTREQFVYVKKWQSTDNEDVATWLEIGLSWCYFFHGTRDKPVFDEEGHALAIMEKIAAHDSAGPLGRQAAFLAGAVYFLRCQYPAADRSFSRIVTSGPDSPWGPKAAELAIISKRLSPGTPEFRRQKRAEIRDLVRTFYREYSELAAQKRDFLERMNNATD